LNAMEDRLHLWEHNRLAAMRLLGDDPGVEPVMIVLMDTRDTVAETLAKALSDLVEAHKAKVEQQDKIPTVVAVLPTAAVARILAPTSPNVAEKLRTMPVRPGCVWVACIAGGSTMLLQTPRTAFPSAGTA